MDNAECNTSPSYTNSSDTPNSKKIRPVNEISATAPPFTPRNQSLYVSSVTFASTTLSPNAPEFFPKNFSASKPITANTKCPSSDHVDALAELQRSVSILIGCPALFEQIMIPLVQTLDDLAKDPIVLSDIAEEIFFQSVTEANFRYTGARMCSYLSENLKSHSGSFQQDLLNRSEREHACIMMSVASEMLPRIIGFTLFMGELLLNMKDSGTGQIISQLPQQIGQLICILIGCPTKETLLCTVQVLKLTGAVLEEFVPDLDDIFSKLQALIQNPDTQPNVRMLMQSVINLRASNWGRRGGELLLTAGAGDNFRDTNTSNEEPGMYHEGGQNYSADDREMSESDFYENFSDGGWQAVDDLGNSGGQYWVGDQEMDEETATAFEQFVAECQTSAPNGNSPQRYGP